MFLGDGENLFSYDRDGNVNHYNTETRKVSIDRISKYAGYYIFGSKPYGKKGELVFLTNGRKFAQILYTEGQSKFISGFSTDGSCLNLFFY